MKNQMNIEQDLPPATTFKIMSIQALTRLIERGPWGLIDEEDEEIGEALKTLHQALEARLRDALLLN